MSEYFVHTNVPELPYNFTLEEAMAFLEATKEYIYCALELGEDPRVLMEQRQRASNYINCQLVWAMP